MSGWIRVSERAPEHNQRVIYFAYAKREKCIGRYRGMSKDSGVHYFWSYGRMDTARWWMPLPDDPKEE